MSGEREREREREREEKEGRTKRVGGVLFQRCETNVQDGVPNRG